MQVDKTNRFLFATTESDSSKVYLGSDGNFYCRRYGLPVHEISKEWATSLAWSEANRRGWFSHLIYFVEGDWIPKLSNPEAQNYIVSNMLKTGTRFPFC